MRIFKTRWFHRWAIDEGLTDGSLAVAVHEMAKGLVDANLGANVVKKRVALPGRGKRGGARTLVAFRATQRAFFVYGFAKNDRANIDERELVTLKRLAAELLGYSDAAIVQALQAAELIEVTYDDQQHT